MIESMKIPRLTNLSTYIFYPEIGVLYKREGLSSRVCFTFVTWPLSRTGLLEQDIEGLAAFLVGMTLTALSIFGSKIIKVNFYAVI